MQIKNNVHNKIILGGMIGGWIIEEGGIGLAKDEALLGRASGYPSSALVGTKQHTKFNVFFKGFCNIHN